MLNGLTRTRVIQFWLAAVAVAVAVGVALGVEVTMSTGILLIASALVPPAILLFLWREAPPPTVAEIMHSTDRQT